MKIINRSFFLIGIFSFFLLGFPPFQFLKEHYQILLLEAGEIPFNHVVIDNNGPADIWQKTTGDLNGDGRIDLIAGGRASGGLVWYENPDWTKRTIVSGGGSDTDAEVADVDGDGDNDIVSLTYSEIRWYE